MNTERAAVFHRLYGPGRPRVSYYDRDFLDYLLMIVVSAGVIVLCYGARHIVSTVGLALCAFALAMFIVRHGVAFQVPLILRRPQDVLYTVAYKLLNLRAVYFAAVALLVVENVLIAVTPRLPHHVDAMRTVALWLFWGHFLAITSYRTVILVAHLSRKELVREVLMQTPWKRVVNGRQGVALEIVHAYTTGVLTHIILIAPWYLVITHARFSVVFLAVSCALNVVIHLKWLKAINEWFYRDHWLGHNSELEFVYLHGSHHDAIPSGLIAVAENGFLEGFLRFTVGSPAPFYNPVMAFLAHTIEVQKDIDAHQYIPGVYPKLPRKVVEVSQHSTHHYGPIEPYSFAIRVDQPGRADEYRMLFRGLPDELRNSAKLDEELTGFEWDNPTYRRTLRLYEEYQK